MDSAFIDINVSNYTNLIEPIHIFNKYKLSNKAIQFIKESRNIISNIINKKDKRLLVVLGPCSIHNYHQAIEYADFISKIQNSFKDELFLVMRVYLEKPRTILGWKGLINDPDLNNTYNINKGLELSCKILNEISEKNVPIATELLDPIITQYISRYISWGSIGARTVESQIHRQLASACSFPIGFKNSTSGNIKVALDARCSAKAKHNFIGINLNGKINIINSKGNDSVHIILRGSKNNGPNYFDTVLDELNENVGIMIDCSHNNKLTKNEKGQFDSIIYYTKTMSDKNIDKIIGFMIESNINEGCQEFIPNKIKYHTSITDPCIGLLDTYQLLLKLKEKKSKSISII